MRVYLSSEHIICTQEIRMVGTDYDLV